MTPERDDFEPLTPDIMNGMSDALLSQINAADLAEAQWQQEIHEARQELNEQNDR